MTDVTRDFSVSQVLQSSLGISKEEATHVFEQVKCVSFLLLLLLCVCACVCVRACIRVCVCVRARICSCDEYLILPCHRPSSLSVKTCMCSCNTIAAIHCCRCWFSSKHFFPPTWQSPVSFSWRTSSQCWRTPGPFKFRSAVRSPLHCWPPRPSFTASQRAATPASVRTAATWARQSAPSMSARKSRRNAGVLWVMSVGGGWWWKWGRVGGLGRKGEGGVYLVNSELFPEGYWVKWCSWSLLYYYYYYCYGHCPLVLELGARDPSLGWQAVKLMMVVSVIIWSAVWTAVVFCLYGYLKLCVDCCCFLKV